MSTAHHKIFLLGGGGVPNYGDELIIQAWLQWYTQDICLPPGAVTVSGGNRRVLETLFQAKYPGVLFSQSVRDARWRAGITFYESIEHGYGYLSDPDNAGARLMRELRGTTVFHLHGGGYLNDRWPTHGFMLGVALWAKENLDCKLVGTGLGLGPMPGPEAHQKIMQQAMQAFDILEVRDGWSHDFIQRNYLHSDPIHGLDDSFVQGIRPQRRRGSTLHLSLRHDEAGGMISRWIPEQFVESFDHHVFWSCAAEDAGAYVQLSKRFPYFEIASTQKLLFDLPVSATDYMVAQRFHPHLVGARLGMQGMFRTGSDYYDIKHGLVTDLGSPFIQGEMSHLKNAKVDFQLSDLARRSPELVGSKRALAARII